MAVQLGIRPCLYCFNCIDAVHLLHCLCPGVQQAQHHLGELRRRGAGGAEEAGIRERQQQQQRKFGCLPRPAGAPFGSSSGGPLAPGWLACSPRRAASMSAERIRLTMARRASRSAANR